MRSFHFVLLTILSLFAAYKSANATHYRSGEITYRLTGFNQIEASVTIYAKWSSPSNLSDKDTARISWGDGTFSTLNRTSTEFVADDIKKSVYIGSHTYSSASPGGIYVISFMDLNRMAGINNISNGNSVEVPFYIEAMVFVNNMNTAGGNSSTVFLNCPCDYANVSDTFHFNPVAYDADGDSLVFSIVTPLREQNTPVPLYVYPDKYCQDLDAASHLFFNKQTGHIDWATPCISGFFNIALLVTEYRCGIPLGTVLRDMQIIVVDIFNAPPILSPVKDIMVGPGENILFNLTATDPQSSQTDSIEILGGAFELGSDGPTFQTTPGNPATGTFSWQPGIAAARSHAYIFSVKAKDNYKVDANTPASLTDMKTFRVWVADTTTCLFSGIEEPDRSSYTANIYPNPSEGKWQLEVSPEMTSSQLEIYSNDGRTVYKSQVQKQTTEMDVNIPAGIYILRIYSGKTPIVRKLIRM